MGIEFSAREMSVLYGLLVENAEDLILRTDGEGFVLKASPSLEHMGFAPSGGLVLPHLLDIVHPAFVDQVRAEFRAILAGRVSREWSEAQMLGANGVGRWFAVRMRTLEDRHGKTDGVLIVLRSIEDRRALEESAFVARMTDPLTGLTNRSAFNEMLAFLVGRGAPGCIAVFDIERFRSITLNHGQRIGDEVLKVSAHVLRAATRSTDILSRLDSEKFGVIMPGTTLDEARALCLPVVSALGEAGCAVGDRHVPVRFRAGVAGISGSFDQTMKDAELALILAHSAGAVPVGVPRGSRPQLS